jgi:cytochrome P450
VFVTGHEEVAAIYRDHDTFSSLNSASMHRQDLPFTPKGDDISDQLEPHRHLMPFGEHLITMDPPQHTGHRALLARLFTPARMKENEDLMWGEADRLIDKFIDKGTCEIINDFTMPFTAIVIGHLLGASQEAHETFLKTWRRPSSLGHDAPLNPMGFLNDYFTGYIEDRRRNPRKDVMSSLVQAKFPDGSTPQVIDLVRLCTIMFAAGQDTSAQFIGTAMRIIAERPDVQRRLREDSSILPDFIEEALRFEGPNRVDYRLVRKSTDVAGMHLKAGTTIVILPLAANRDPKRFKDPDEFNLDRDNMREHITFARGVHTCIGAPLARQEAKTGLTRLLARLGDIRISEKHHGPRNARHFEYDPATSVRAMSALHLEFTPIR